MKDLTKGSIVNHLLTLATPRAIGMLTHIAYQLVDLYFVTRISRAATAGVSAAGNASFIVAALAQVLGIGTVSLIARAVGRRDRVDANMLLNQALLLSIICGATMVTLMSLFIGPYMRSVAADMSTVEAGTTFIFGILIGLALYFPMIVFGSALRSMGIIRPEIAVHVLTILINAVLAPVLIAGWGTGAALGVMGAGLATSISIFVGTISLAVCFHRSQEYMAISRQMMSPKLKQWRRILTVGLPVGGEIALMFLSAGVVYYVVRDFGTSAQAGYGIGARVLQATLLPGMSIAMAAGPIAAQNFGAQSGERVKETFRKAVTIGTGVMIVTMIFVQCCSPTLVEIFDTDASAVAAATGFLQLMSWAFVAQGLVYTCSSMFQALGNTLPSLASSCTCFFAFAAPAVWLSTQPTFNIKQVWALLAASVMLQALVSLCLLLGEFKRRLIPTRASASSRTEEPSRRPTMP